MSGQCFRPSPNFIHMKKYQKARSHLSNLVQVNTNPTESNAESSQVTEAPKPVENPTPTPQVVEAPKVVETQPIETLNVAPPQVPPNVDLQCMEDVKPVLANTGNLVTVKTEPYYNEPMYTEQYYMPDVKPPLPYYFQPPLPPEIHPPLPPHPHPNDIKQEMADIKYMDTSQPMQYMDYEQSQEIPGEIMCRNFFRGICRRGNSCLYTHKIILSQLHNVYRFCNDYQNSICKRAKCKFVHATVFEKENFLRTGYIPEHTMAHMKEDSVLPPPPPPAEPAPEIPMYYSMLPPPPPPPVQESVPSVQNPMSMYGQGQSYQMPNQMPTAPVDPYANPTPGTSSSNYNPWMQYQQNPVASTSYEQAMPPPAPKEDTPCSSCDINDFRVKYNIYKNEKLRKENAELDQKLAEMDVKKQVIHIFLTTILQSQSGNSAAQAEMERQPDPMEQLTALLRSRDAYNM